MKSMEPSSKEALRDLASFLTAIHEYLSDVVLCGGWVPYFYRNLSRSESPKHDPLLTFDFDVVVPSDLSLKSGGSLHDQLLKGYFIEIRNREPPVVYYQHSRWGKDILAPIYGEILTPLKGSYEDRSGKPKCVHTIQGNVVVQSLRYLELLLNDPLTIQGNSVKELGLQEGMVIQISNPASFILQKAVALKHRKADKRRKDLAYVFEVAMLWLHESKRVQEMVHSIADHSTEWARWVERGKTVLLREFDSEYSDGPVSVEQVFGATVDGHLVSAKAAARVVSEFLRETFQ